MAHANFAGTTTLASDEEVAPAARTPVRSAGSLVLFRPIGQSFEVLVGRRGKGARFKPGVYVFPGGGVEPADACAEPLTSLASELPAAMACSKRQADAIALAAVRELYEETGLMLGEPGDIGTTKHPSWQEFRDRRLAPSLVNLDFLGRAITPTYHRTRYHARFFATDAERVSGAIGGNGELDDLRWVRTDRIADLETTIIQKAIAQVLHERLQGRAAPAKKLFFKWGRHNFLDI